MNTILNLIFFFIRQSEKYNLLTNTYALEAAEYYWVTVESDFLHRTFRRLAQYSINPTYNTNHQYIEGIFWRSRFGKLSTDNTKSTMYEVYTCTYVHLFHTMIRRR